MGLKKTKLKYLLNSNSKSHGTNFEDLSNELIYEVFDHLSEDQINQAFTSLNSRLQKLVEDYQYSHNPDGYPTEHPCRYLRSKGSMALCARYQVALVNFSEITSIRTLRLANLTSRMSLRILENIPLEQLESIYLGALSDRGEHYNEYDPVDQLQEKILQSGQFKLRKCVFRMKFNGKCTRIPEQLPALEYLRIDGCQNVGVVHELLHRMPNLRKLQVSIMESIPNDQIRFITRSQQKCLSLTHLSIHTLNLQSPNDLQTLFEQYISNLHVLIIRLNYITSTSQRNANDNAFTNRRDWTYNIIPLYLPHLKEFHLRQRITPHMLSLPSLVIDPLPYREELFHSSVSSKSYQIFITKHLTETWLGSA